MVTHIVAWNFKPEVKEEEKAALKAEMKKNLESLVGKVPGLLSAEFFMNPVAGSNKEMCLMTTHDDVEAVKAYSVHPEHVHVADTFVRPYTCERACINLEK
ncbi:MAG: Dabb family protein [Eubacteriales bacterium]|nr:Dabb family protein [Eubacteriales bacterium]